ncbi:MAG: SpoIID/LytB domain-containing protein [Cyclobacteriaceae bacterium]|nr:SpoIID/LytB domain-containing protein [Cyclobacteriaceae bacterium]
MNAPTIDVGIMLQNEVHIILHGEYTDFRGDYLTGDWKVWVENGGLYLSNLMRAFQIEEGFTLMPQDSSSCSVTLNDVTIGIGFHWERKENQTFKGGLRFIIENQQVRVINRLTIEDYLKSVISSEMSATSSTELLKAHAVISRSWLLAQIVKNKELVSSQSKYQAYTETDDERVRWYDREDHENFDVCADDHCQRYQGISRATTKEVENAVNETAGEVLTYEGKICDARFSKCCGGMMELFENAWEPIHHPYLRKAPDALSPQKGFDLALENEPAARAWIHGNPEAFCNTHDKRVLSQVLNDYDRETNDFFRWKVAYTQRQISELVNRKSGIDFGEILDFEPLQRGASGRIIRLKIIGSKRTKIIGKELEIRKALSESHLYSSAIVFEKKQLDGVVYFELTGAGWGHGVGLCQIGAAVMGDKGYGYRAILDHYFRGSKIAKMF